MGRERSDESDIKVCSNMGCGLMFETHGTLGGPGGSVSSEPSPAEGVSYCNPQAVSRGIPCDAGNLRSVVDSEVES